MKVLVVGANGFIGRHATGALRAAGHEVMRGVRHPRDGDEVTADLARMLRKEDWRAALAGVHAVLNVAGVFSERRGARFLLVHEAGPRALFAACADAGVRKVVQVSALGADEEAKSSFHLSKRAGDAALAGSELDWSIVYPSLVFGAGGHSSTQLAALASMPVIPIPGDGAQMIQPVHMADLAAALVALIEGRASKCRLAAVGPRAITVKEYLGALREQMGLPSARYQSIPLPIVRAFVGREAVDMLVRGNTADVASFERVLGRPTRPAERFVEPAGREAFRTSATLAWMLPLLRGSVAVTWLWSGIASFGLYPIDASLALLARVGLAGPAAYAALFGAAAADVALGIATLLLPRRIRLWRTQLAFIVAYTAIISLALPELWLHPFGPVLKNVPLMAAILLLHELEPRNA